MTFSELADWLISYIQNMQAWKPSNRRWRQNAQTKSNAEIRTSEKPNMTYNLERFDKSFRQ